MAGLPAPKATSYLQYEKNHNCQPGPPRFALESLPNPFFEFQQYKYLHLIQKESMGPLISEVWNKNIFNFAAKMFFQPRQMKVSSYNGIWYKNFQTNILLLRFID